jgi:hypothetical protein
VNRADVESQRRQRDDAASPIGFVKVELKKEAVQRRQVGTVIEPRVARFYRSKQTKTVKNIYQITTNFSNLL